jgi:IS1 family transposase
MQLSGGRYAHEREGCGEEGAVPPAACDGERTFSDDGEDLGVNHVLVYRWVRAFGEYLPEPVVSGGIQKMELDEMWHFIGSKKRNSGSSRPCRCTRRTVAWVLGSRDAGTFRRLYDKVKDLKHCVYYTDHWNAFAEVLPSERHLVGKAHITHIERDNSNTRHYLGDLLAEPKWSLAKNSWSTSPCASGMPSQQPTKSLSFSK